jgi:hypothetical protein
MNGCHETRPQELETVWESGLPPKLARILPSSGQMNLFNPAKSRLSREVSDNPGHSYSLQKDRICAIQ